MQKPTNGSKPSATIPKLAYRDERFLESTDARILRILSEYLEPQTRLRREGVQNTVVFFGSKSVLPRDVAMQRLAELEGKAQIGESPAEAAKLKAARMAVQMSRYYEDARDLARLITQWSLGLNRGKDFLVVCSGGGPGIMEAANRGALEAGGKSIGFNIVLPREQMPNPYITSRLSFSFRYFFMRKLWFAQPAKALIVFPGGFGTMDEMWEFLTLLQTGRMNPRVAILLYGSKYWKRAIDFGWLLETATISRQDLNLIRYADSPPQAFEILKEKLGREPFLRTTRSKRFF
jgi:uncharacterized protein (TIGR00730 family)